MNTRPLQRLLATGFFCCMAAAAHASDTDCFPLCPETRDTVPANSAPVTDSPADTTCGNGLVDKAEALNNKIKPVKEIAGYIRSPQGLAVKLVNDHVVKIPAWVGYAVDPVGSLKNRAVGEVRSQLKQQLLPKQSCATPAQDDALDASDRYSI